MADLKTSQSSYSPDNRLSFDQVVVMAQRLQARHGVSSLRAMKMVEETQAERQKLLDERVSRSGGIPWSKLRQQDPNADATWGGYAGS